MHNDVMYNLLEIYSPSKSPRDDGGSAQYRLAATGGGGGGVDFGVSATPLGRIETTSKRS